jgi:hypothetical protein
MAVCVRLIARLFGRARTIRATGGVRCSVCSRSIQNYHYDFESITLSKPSQIAGHDPAFPAAAMAARPGGFTTRALPLGGSVSLVKIMDRCWIVGLALAIVSMATCAKSSPIGASPTASSGTAQSGRQLLRRVDDRGCGHGVGLNCPRCDIQFAGPGLLEFEFAWRVSLPGPRDWVMTLTRSSTRSVSE